MKPLENMKIPAAEAACFSSADSLASWLAENPHTVAVCGLSLQRSDKGQVWTLLQHYASVDDAKASRLELAQAELRRLHSYRNRTSLRNRGYDQAPLGGVGPSAAERLAQLNAEAAKKDAEWRKNNLPSDII